MAFFFFFDTCVFAQWPSSRFEAQRYSYKPLSQLLVWVDLPARLSARVYRPSAQPQSLQIFLPQQAWTAVSFQGTSHVADVQELLNTFFSKKRRKQANALYFQLFRAFWRWPAFFFFDKSFLVSPMPLVSEERLPRSQSASYLRNLRVLPFFFFIEKWRLWNFYTNSAVLLYTMNMRPTGGGAKHAHAYEYFTEYHDMFQDADVRFFSYPETFFPRLPAFIPLPILPEEEDPLKMSGTMFRYAAARYLRMVEHRGKIVRVLSFLPVEKKIRPFTIWAYLPARPYLLAYYPKLPSMQAPYIRLLFKNQAAGAFGNRWWNRDLWFARQQRLYNPVAEFSLFHTAYTASFNLAYNRPALREHTLAVFPVVELYLFPGFLAPRVPYLSPASTAEDWANHLAPLFSLLHPSAPLLTVGQRPSALRLWGFFQKKNLFSSRLLALSKDEVAPPATFLTFNGSHWLNWPLLRLEFEKKITRARKIVHLFDWHLAPGRARITNHAFFFWHNANIQAKRLALPPLAWFVSPALNTISRKRLSIYFWQQWLTSTPTEIGYLFDRGGLTSLLYEDEYVPFITTKPRLFYASRVAFNRPTDAITFYYWQARLDFSLLFSKFFFLRYLHPSFQRDRANLLDTVDVYRAMRCPGVGLTNTRTWSSAGFQRWQRRYLFVSRPSQFFFIYKASTRGARWSRVELLPKALPRDTYAVDINLFLSRARLFSYELAYLPRTPMFNLGGVSPFLTRGGDATLRHRVFAGLMQLNKDLLTIPWVTTLTFWTEFLAGKKQRSIRTLDQCWGSFLVSWQKRIFWERYVSSSSIDGFFDSFFLVGSSTVFAQRRFWDTITPWLLAEKQHTWHAWRKRRFLFWAKTTPWEIAASLNFFFLDGDTLAVIPQERWEGTELNTPWFNFRMPYLRYPQIRDTLTLHSLRQHWVFYTKENFFFPPYQTVVDLYKFFFFKGWDFFLFGRNRALGSDWVDSVGAAEANTLFRNPKLRAYPGFPPLDTAQTATPRAVFNVLSFYGLLGASRFFLTLPATFQALEDNAPLYTCLKTKPLTGPLDDWGAAKRAYVLERQRTALFMLAVLSAFESLNQPGTPVNPRLFTATKLTLAPGDILQRRLYLTMLDTAAVSFTRLHTELTLLTEQRLRTFSLAHLSFCQVKALKDNGTSGFLLSSRLNLRTLVMPPQLSSFRSLLQTSLLLKLQKEIPSYVFFSFNDQADFFFL